MKLNLQCRYRSGVAVGTVLTDESPMLEGGAARVLFMYALRGNHWVGLYAVELINAIVGREILIVPPWVGEIIYSTKCEFED